MFCPVMFFLTQKMPHFVQSKNVFFIGKKSEGLNNPKFHKKMYKLSHSYIIELGVMQGRWGHQRSRRRVGVGAVKPWGAISGSILIVVITV